MEVSLGRLWQYGVWSFQTGGYKIRKIFASESTYWKIIIEFWELGIILVSKVI